MNKTLLALGISAALTFAALQTKAVTIVGLTTNNQIFTMANASSPGTITGPFTVSGIASGQTLVALDFRPKNGTLYALAYNSVSGEAQIYTLNTSTNVATAVGTTMNLQLGTGNSVGFDFNVINDNKVLITGTNGHSYFVNADLGMVISSATSLQYASNDIMASATPAISGTAHLNNFFGADVTMLTGFDVANNTFVSFDGSNNTTLHTIGLTGIVAQPNTPVALDASFDAATHVNTTYMSATTLASSSYKLYTINTSTGMASMVGTIGSGNIVVKDIAVVVTHNVPANITGTLMVGLTLNNGNLITFDSDIPGTVRDVIQITGMTSGQVMLAIDYRPSNQTLYGFGYNHQANLYQLYTIDLNTGVATAINATASLNLANSTKIGFDFNPVTDKIRLMAKNHINIVLDANTGAILTTDANPQFASQDINSNATVDIGAIAHTNSYPGAASTDLIAVDLSTGSLAQFTANSNAAATLSTISNVTGLLNGNGNNAINGSLDFHYMAASSANLGLVTTNVGGGLTDFAQLYEMTAINSGLTLVGSVGPGIPLQDVAAKPSSSLAVPNITLQENGVLVYPNPVNHSATITLAKSAAKTVNVSVLDLNGRVISMANYQPGNQYNIDVNGLISGVYMIKVQEEGSEAKMVKFVKQ
jgi:hypothetical protein